MFLYLGHKIQRGNDFVRAEAKSHRLQITDTVEIDVALEIGDVGESVIISADAPLLETSSGSLGTVVDARRVQLALRVVY